jgi:cysteine desulfurase
MPMIYLDNNATTQPDPAAVDAMLPFLREHYGNASSGHRAAQPVRRALQKAREQVATFVDCAPEEVVFTSGGTEADNAAIASAIQSYPTRRHLVTCATEHDAVLRYLQWLEESHGYAVTRLPVDANGQMSLDALADAIRPGETALVSIMAANNETGVAAPIVEAAAIAEAQGVLFHTDAVHAVGKMPMRVKESSIHYLALSGHKFHAPKGVGALIVNQRVAFRPSMLGGGQESARRAGTENIASIVALGEAASRAQDDSASIGALRDFFEAELLKRVAGTTIHGQSVARSNNTSSLRIHGVEGAAMMVLLDQKGVCVSAGSACHTGSHRSSHVLAAMGLSAEAARETLRVSLSRFTTRAEIDEALMHFAAAAERVRSLTGGR